MTVEVHIYRSSDQSERTLEVVDQDDASTAWDNLFATDQAALDEVMPTCIDLLLFYYRIKPGFTRRNLHAPKIVKINHSIIG